MEEKDDHMILKKQYVLLFMVFLLGLCLCVCKKGKERQETILEESTKSDEVAEQWEKGYDLPLDDRESEKAENDCNRVMTLISDIYENAEKGNSWNTILSDEDILKIQSKVKETGQPVATSIAYTNMENYEKMDRFLKACEEGKKGSMIVYEVHSDGGIGRNKFTFDGKEMYVLAANAIWKTDHKPGIPYISYTRIKEWNYTEKGWFGYELCVPEPPEVSEIVDGSCLLRVKPMSTEQREMSEKCVQGLGYQGNNLLCSNWDQEHMEELDYNGIYEYLYAMKYQKSFDPEDGAKGIPKEEFESLLMEYLPITAEQIQEYAAFDQENQTYTWERKDDSDWTFFGTSLPEVTDIKKNQDGTVTLVVDAVCDMVICDDAVITHELTVKFAEDGSFQYLGNKIRNGDVARYK